MGGGTTRRSARKGEEEDKDARGAAGGGGTILQSDGGRFFFQNDREIRISSSWWTNIYVTQGVLRKKIERMYCCMYCCRGTYIELRRIDAK
jgi:hypothetical protein